MTPLEIAIFTLEKISEMSKFNEDPEYTPERSYGNYDDCFYDGDAQATYDIAAFAREALAKIKPLLK